MWKSERRYRQSDGMTIMKKMLKKRMIEVVMTGAFLAALTGCGKKNASSGVTKIEAGGSLDISTKDLSEKASFYPIEVDGTEMEIIAGKAADGTIRTAFNTCQICYDSGQGYYKQDGEKLVCQNCGNAFTMDQVGTVAGGCHPWPILAENETVTEDQVQISYDFLKEAETIFSNWKKQ